MKVSLCENLKNREVIGVDTIYNVLQKIKNGHTKQQVMLAREYGKGTPNYEQIKAQIPTFTPNGEFYGIRKTSNLVQLSGFIYFDFDNYMDKQRITEFPFIYACWHSLSNEGLGCLVIVDGLTTDNFLIIWNYLSEYFKQHQIITDSACKDISRQNVISFDPDIYINTSSAIVNAIQIVNSLSSSQAPEYLSTSNQISNYVSSYTSNTFNYSSNNSYTNPIIYKTTLSDYKGQDYVVIEQGKPYRGVYLPKQIFDGERHKWLCYHIINLLFLNPTIDYNTLENELLNANSNHCHPKLDVKEVISLSKWFFNKHSTDSLNIKVNLKKIWFNPSSTLTKKEKKVIVGKEAGALRRKKTLNRIQEAYDILKLNHIKVTQKMIKEFTGFSLRTIKCRWHEIIK